FSRDWSSDVCSSDLDRPGADPAAWPALVAVALVSTAIPAAVYFWLVRHAGPARASLTTCLVPVVGLLAGWLALHEVPTPLGMLGDRKSVVKGQQVEL